MFLNVVGFVLLGTVAVTNLPQIVHMLRSGNTSGVSLTMHASFMMSWSLWLVYALSVGDWVLIASNVLGAVVEAVVTVIIVVYRYSHHESVWGTFKNERHNLWVLALTFLMIGFAFWNLDLMVILLAFVDVTIIFPQVVEVFKVEDLSGNSLASWWLFVVEAVLCIVYSVGIGEPLSYAWAFLFLSCYLVIIWKVTYYRLSKVV